MLKACVWEHAACHQYGSYNRGFNDNMQQYQDIILAVTLAQLVQVAKAHEHLVQRDSRRTSTRKFHASQVASY